MNYVLKAKKAIEEILNLKVPEGMAFSAVLAVDEWGDEKQIIKDATSYLEKLSRAYKNALNTVSSYISSQAKSSEYIRRITDKLDNALYYVNAQYDEQIIEGYLESEACEYLEESLGIKCPEEDM